MLKKLFQHLDIRQMGIFWEYYWERNALWTLIGRGEKFLKFFMKFLKFIFIYLFNIFIYLYFIKCLEMLDTMETTTVTSFVLLWFNFFLLIPVSRTEKTE